MQTEPITINVDSKTARAYRNASPEERERVEERTREVLRLALMSKEEAAAEFKRLTHEMSEYARAQGLTPEKLAELLRDDDDD